MYSKAVFALVIATSCALGLSGCDSFPAGSTSVGGADSAPISTAGGGLRLQAGDKLKVSVFGEDKLSGEYEIDPAGYVSLPLAGTVQAAGLTKLELEQALTKKFRAEQYLRNAKVTVDIANFRPFYVLGEVEKPGKYPYESGLNVVSAVAVAGGNTYRSSLSRVLIQRAGEHGFKEYPFSPNVFVFPGDLIRVPERYF